MNIFQNKRENFDLKRQINFIGRLEEDATMFLLLRKKKKLLLIFNKILQLLFDMYKNGNSKDCKLIKWF